MRRPYREIAVASVQAAERHAYTATCVANLRDPPAERVVPATRNARVVDLETSVGGPAICTLVASHLTPSQEQNFLSESPLRSPNAAATRRDPESNSVILSIPPVTQPRQKEYQKEYFKPRHGWNRVWVLTKWRTDSPIVLSGIGPFACAVRSTPHRGTGRSSFSRMTRVGPMRSLIGRPRRVDGSEKTASQA